MRREWDGERRGRRKWEREGRESEEEKARSDRGDSWKGCVTCSFQVVTVRFSCPFHMLCPSTHLVTFDAVLIVRCFEEFLLRWLDLNWHESHHVIINIVTNLLVTISFHIHRLLFPSPGPQRWLCVLMCPQPPCLTTSSQPPFTPHPPCLFSQMAETGLTS